MKSNELKEELIVLLNKGNAHVPLDNALEGIPYDRVTEQPEGLPYSIWSLAEHLRIAQWDIVAFCKNSQHQSPEWPGGYWPESKHPSEEDWDNCIKQIKADRNEMKELINKSTENLMEPFPHGKGQSLFREALLIADHNSYHTGEIIVLRRLLDLWEEGK